MNLHFDYCIRNQYKIDSMVNEEKIEIDLLQKRLKIKLTYARLTTSLSKIVGQAIVIR